MVLTFDATLDPRFSRFREVVEECVNCDCKTGKVLDLSHPVASALLGQILRGTVGLQCPHCNEEVMNSSIVTLVPRVKDG